MSVSRPIQRVKPQLTLIDPRCISVFHRVSVWVNIGSTAYKDQVIIVSKISFWQKMLLIVGGVAFALVMVTIVLRAFPNLIKGSGPVQRSEANTVIQVEFHHSQGDLFVTLPGRIRPPADDPILAAFTLTYDADSFRMPAQQAEHYPIAAFGDSFTEGYNVAAPWPDKLAELLNIPIRNYGYRSYGPREVADTIKQFAGREPRQWVLYAFFSGNDLGDTNRAAALSERSPFYLLPQLAEQAAEEMSTQVAQNQQEHYDFPMPVIIGGNYYEMAFLTYYLFRQLAPPEGFEASRTFQLFEEALDEMTTSTPDTCRALIFIPTKEQLYYPYIYPTERHYIRQNAYRAFLDSSQILQLEPEPLDEADEPNMIAHLNDQRDAVQKLIERKEGWYFIDLLPTFQAHVDAGELLYYPYDSHWNQDGHNLAAQVIAEELGNIADCPPQ